MLARILEQYPEDVRIVFRHFPLVSVHDKAAIAMQAAEAAGMQGKFWELHDMLFERQAEWTNFSPEQFSEWVSERAKELDLDIESFTEEMLSQEQVDAAQTAWNRGVETGMPGTPFLLYNGEIWPSGLPMNFGNVSAIVDLVLLERRQFSECPAMIIDTSKQYIATLFTERGEIVIELFADKAPIAVNNFIFLAKNGWYDNVTFHRVISGFVAQAGDPSGTGFGGPGYAFVNENSPDLIFDKPGLLAMANSGRDSNGSQFFITYAPAPQLDGGYTIFGRVIQGFEVAKSLRPRDPSQSLDLPPGDRILKVEIVEK